MSGRRERLLPTASEYSVVVTSVRSCLFGTSWSYGRFEGSANLRFDGRKRVCGIGSEKENARVAVNRRKIMGGSAIGDGDVICGRQEENFELL